MVELPEPDELLIAGTLQQARVEYPEWPDRQVVTPQSFTRLFGRRFRVAWYTAEAEAHRDWTKVRQTLELSARKNLGGEVRPIWERT